MESIREQKSLQLPTLNFYQQSAKRLTLSACEKIVKGRLTIQDGSESYCFGETESDAEVHAHINVHEPRAYAAFLTNGTIGAGETYMRREWSTPDLLAVVRLMVQNISWLSKMNQKRSLPIKLALKFNQWLTANTKRGSKKNISAHYDLGNDFFEHFLDKEMMYSSAIYTHKNQSLEDAAANKLDIICQKLELNEDDHLLEIGTGWGGMAIHAAQHYGCKVTTTTISKEQHAYAKARVEALGLEDKITLLLEDYRDLSGQYDKLVSVEMIEAVGAQFFSSYFQQCNRLLKADGLMLIQAITIPDDRYEFARKNTDFIKKMIFPGGCLPSNAILAQNLYKHTDMQMIDLHDITEHYANTLAEWHDRFHGKLADIKAMGYSSEFCRMWEFYLRYCEGGFRERVIGTVQVVLAKPEYRHAPV